MEEIVDLARGHATVAAATQRRKDLLGKRIGCAKDAAQRRFGVTPQGKGCVEMGYLDFTSGIEEGIEQAKPQTMRLGAGHQIPKRSFDFFGELVILLGPYLLSIFGKVDRPPASGQV